MKIEEMYIFDLDGTMDLTDPRLTAKILKISKHGTIFVTATGRTNNYVREICRKYGIMPPRYIIADNGGTIYDNVEKRYIMKTTLPLETRRKILEEYMRLGGILDDVRYTDGDSVFASKEENVKKYYEQENIVEYKEPEELMRELLSGESDITKITLAGNKKLMQRMIEFIQSEGIKTWTDIGATKFPRRARKNYRLDITDGETSKGKAVEFLSEHIGVDNFTCIGNGPNDFSMFKYALDRGKPVVIVRNAEEVDESKALVNQVEEYATKIGQPEKVTIVGFPINGYIDRLDEGKNAKERRQNFARRLENKIGPKVDTRRKGRSNIVINARER